MRISFKDISIGCAVECKRTGFTATVLGNTLKFFERFFHRNKWDGWGWHLMFVSRYDAQRGWIVCESLGCGVVESPLSNYKPEELRFYRWLDNPKQEDIDKFVKAHLGKKYDILIYFFTTLGYFLRHIWGRPIPYLFDNYFSCWELLYHFFDSMKKPLAAKYDFPLISDAIKILK